MTNIVSTNARAFDRALSHSRLRFRDLLRPYRVKLALGALVLFLTNLVIVILPMLINAGVSLIDSNDKSSVQFFSWSWPVTNLHHLIGLIIILALFGALIRTGSRALIFDVGRSVERDVRSQVLCHISALDDDFYSRHLVGDLMNHLTTDVTNIRLVTGFVALNLMNIMMVFCFTVPLLLRIDVLLALCALLPFPMVMLATRGISKKMFENTKSYQESLSKLVNHVQESLLGAHVVRLFHQQRAEGIRFAACNRETFLAGLNLARVRVLMFPIMRLVIGSALALILWAGGQAVWSHRISLGDFVEINARILQMTWPAMSIGFVMSMLSRGRASLLRLNNILDKRALIVDGPDTISDVQKIDVIDLKLNPKSTTTINFSLSRGQILGLVGVSGSYKSRLLKMLYRRELCDEGSIFYNHHDVNNLKLNALYRQVAVVNQEPFLFHKSIKDNISFLKPDASLDEINEVIKLVKLDSDISQFNDGINTIIGERGITLSGGQRQRVALARALLSPRPVLILDDAMSAVDADTETFIIAQIKSRLAQSIVIMVSHRLAAIKDADLIIILDRGEVSAKGRHTDLLHSSQLYRELWGRSHE
jgi:ATP-binding cassette subfamily B multidrug efflux pump